MAKKVLLVLFLILLFIIPLIFASTTEINIKTKPNHKILIIAEKTGTFPPERIKSFAPYKNTGILGEVKVSLTTDESAVDIKLDLISTDSVPDLNNIVENIPVKGEPVFINFFPGNLTYTVGSPAPAVVNTTNDNSTLLNQTNNTDSIMNASLTLVNQTNINNKSNFSITGFVSKTYENNSKTIFYILIVIGVIVVVLVIMFIARKLPKGSSSHHESFKHVPFSPSLSSNSSHSLISAERKLKEAQAEIESIKRRNEEIRNAERKLQEDAMRLEKLRRGY